MRKREIRFYAARYFRVFGVWPTGKVHGIKALLCVLNEKDLCRLFLE